MRDRIAGISGSLYSMEREHDACGVGFIADIRGNACRRVVEKGIDALKALFHRGAVDADGMTGDGAGLSIEIPHEFFVEYLSSMGNTVDEGSLLAVGQIFLPDGAMGAQEECRCIVESELIRGGCRIYGWRHVPIREEYLGTKAASTKPKIEQILIASKQENREEFEKTLFIIRKRIERRISTIQSNSFYICSLSCYSVIYKGMVLSEHLADFYPDLQSEKFISSFAVYHQRYSTNTMPTWWLAQPFRIIAHNGEINTLKGNTNWMRNHEVRIAGEYFPEHESDICPVIPLGSSDSAALDAVFEVIIRGGSYAPDVKSCLIPEVVAEDDEDLASEIRDMYELNTNRSEAWDGPAAIVAYDGRYVMAGMDRNGLRPLRYAVTSDDLIIAGSETGIVDVEDDKVIERGRLGPGQMVAVDLINGSLIRDAEIKSMVSKRTTHSYSDRIHLNQDVLGYEENEEVYCDNLQLTVRQKLFGYSREDIDQVIYSMAKTGKESSGSMGDDTPLAVLSNKYRPLSHYFRQRFAQITNPPIDPIRESRAMCLKTRLYDISTTDREGSNSSRVISVDSPVILNGELITLQGYLIGGVKEIYCTFPIQDSSLGMQEALESIRKQAEEAVTEGYSHIVLTDKNISPDRAPIPMILATSAVHSWLVRRQLRLRCSLTVQTGECHDPHYFAVLIGCGATLVNAYLAQESIVEGLKKGILGDDISIHKALLNFKTAIEQGLLKIMSKMGISLISSYRSGYNFEALGLSRALMSEYFLGVDSCISGIGCDGLQRRIEDQHIKAFQDSDREGAVLQAGGFYKMRHDGETHAWDAPGIHLLQTACDRNDQGLFRRYVNVLNSHSAIHVRDLFEFCETDRALCIDDVESVASIRTRFVSAGMSLGALSPEAHEVLNLAMNRIGASSNSGEGGEDPEKYRNSGDNECRYAKIKQVASGRFGVTAEYLNNCSEIEIKIAQGAKPGEGGQLPGFKVTEMLAKLRNSTPGVTLISPPPHHDIYSIEDIAQLIYDLKMINPVAKVTVKLVAATGVGTIAAGVAKAKADNIVIAGHNGGTGASPLTSIKFAGLPWEIGLAEAHQVLSFNDLRSSVTLRVDGGIRTGRDVVIAAILGAEEFGIGTAALVAMGCIMVRQCHSNTCPVGICTQNPELIKKFTGTVDKVVNLMNMIAQDTREVLVSLGVRSIDEVVGRTDLLRQVHRMDDNENGLDLNPVLYKFDCKESCVQHRSMERTPVADTLDSKILKDAEFFFTKRTRMNLSYNVRNTYRSVGVSVSSRIVRTWGMKNDLEEGHLTLSLSGSCGQSLGAFAVHGICIDVVGDSNDYVGKGLSGGTIIIRPPADTVVFAQSHKNTIIGNTVLYGATSGSLFAAGQAGERFSVRNSGARAVIEGCGSNGCEYMTGGVVAILGDVGFNFAAGMTGGMAYIYDEHGKVRKHINPDSVVIRRVDKEEEWGKILLGLVKDHSIKTGSLRAISLLDNWDSVLANFYHIVPKEMCSRYGISDKSII